MEMYSGKVALITGATSGIGRATALAFARQGAKVVLAGRRKEQGEAVLKEIQALNGEAIFIQTDVTVYVQIEALFKKAIAHYGRLDFAFNNAGILKLSPMTEFTEADCITLFNTNLLAVFYCMQFEIRQMQKNGGGVIVNYSSLAGIRGIAENTLYTASKHGVIGLTRAAAIEYARDNIRINTICPAYVHTALDDYFIDYYNITSAQLAAASPLGRQNSAENIAEFVLFLCSTQASYIQGAVLSIDGGASAATSVPRKPKK
ncbi:glucose 1-dehydrogenase [Legionella sp. D16C41]|uniref:glucose 1-dehydrogenase n=1 Tax=Legionella sp. D16C41 TaxID=3402688 RepID=UPI003AF6979A